ncbi:hypothetical protein [Thermococcus sp.]
MSGAEILAKIFALIGVLLFNVSAFFVYILKKESFIIPMLIGVSFLSMALLFIFIWKKDEINRRFQQVESGEEH